VLLINRFRQDLLKNVFSQIRRRSGKTPTALQCRRGMKLISISQYLCKVNSTSYLSDLSVFLVDFFTGMGKEHVDRNTTSMGPSEGVVLPKLHSGSLPWSTYKLFYDKHRLVRLGSLTELNHGQAGIQKRSCQYRVRWKLTQALMERNSFSVCFSKNIEVSEK